MPEDQAPPAIYHYHRVTKEFLGSSVARIDPKEAEPTPLIPANATLDAPPEAGENQSAVFEDGAWALVDDYRGQTFYKPDGEEFIISDLDFPPESDWTTEKPVDFVAEIKRIRNEKIYGGLTVGAVTVDTEDVSQSRLTAVRIKADQDANYTVDWKTQNGFVTLDAPTIIAISDAVLKHVQACFTAEANTDVENASDLSAMEAEFNSEYDTFMAS